MTRGTVGLGKVRRKGKRDWAEIEDNLAGSRACKEGGGWARGKCNPAAGKWSPTARKCIPSMKVEEKDRGDGKGNGNRREERRGDEKRRTRQTNGKERKKRGNG